MEDLEHVVYFINVVGGQDGTAADVKARNRQGKKGGLPSAQEHLANRTPFYEYQNLSTNERVVLPQGAEEKNEEQPQSPLMIQTFVNKKTHPVA